MYNNYLSHLSRFYTITLKNVWHNNMHIYTGTTKVFQNHNLLLKTLSFDTIISELVPVPRTCRIVHLWSSSWSRCSRRPTPRRHRTGRPGYSGPWYGPGNGNNRVKPGRNGKHHHLPSKHHGLNNTLLKFTLKFFNPLVCFRFILPRDSHLQVYTIEVRYLKEVM